jgi:hypothetical protein
MAFYLDLKSKIFDLIGGIIKNKNKEEK